LSDSLEHRAKSEELFVIDLNIALCSKPLALSVTKAGVKRLIMKEKEWLIKE